MSIILAIYLCIVGAAFGSFAGAMVWRIKHRRNVVSERSECEHCHHVLAVRDLIPVVSWLWLGGKCRYCKKPIGRQALLMELGLGAVFALTYICWPGGLSTGLDWMVFALWLVALVGLTILFVYDLRWYLLPDVIVWPLTVLGLIIFGLQAVGLHMSLSTALVSFLWALLPVTGLYGVLYLVSGGKWVGLGDVKLGIFIGLALGWQGAIGAVVLANLIGTLIILPGLMSGKLKRSSQIPFGPLLILGTWVSLLFGSSLLQAYLHFLGV